MPLIVKVDMCLPDKLSNMLQVLSTASKRIQRLGIEGTRLFPPLPHLELTNLRSISIRCESITKAQLFEFLDMANLSEQDDIRFRMDTNVIENLEDTVANPEGHPLLHRVKVFDLNWRDGMHYSSFWIRTKYHILRLYRSHFATFTAKGYA